MKFVKLEIYYLCSLIAILINSCTGFSADVLSRLHVFKLVPLANASYADGLRSFGARIVALIWFYIGAWCLLLECTICELLWLLLVDTWDNLFHGRISSVLLRFYCHRRRLKRHAYGSWVPPKNRVLVSPRPSHTLVIKS